jgi:uncharacterized protein YggT (Ycf19 family)
MARVTEVTRTVTNEDAVASADPDGATIAERLVYLLGGLLIVLLGLRVLLSLLGANRGNWFADFIYSVTYPFVKPFFGLFGYSVQYGVSRFEIETVVAIVVYALIIALIARLVSLGAPRRRPL